jgi:hypothetical protein
MAVKRVVCGYVLVRVRGMRSPPSHSRRSGDDVVDCRGCCHGMCLISPRARKRRREGCGVQVASWCGRRNGWWAETPGAGGELVGFRRKKPMSWRRTS